MHSNKKEVLVSFFNKKDSNLFTEKKTPDNINFSIEDQKQVARMQKVMLGMVMLVQTFEEIDAKLSDEQKKNLAAYNEIPDPIYGTYHGKEIRFTNEPKIKFFNAVVQCYKDAKMDDKAIETLQKREEWIKKYSFES